MKELLGIKLTALLIFFVLAGVFILAGKSAKSPGIYEQILALKRGNSLRFTLSIPQSYTGNQAVPLVLALHYGGEVTPFYGKGVLLYLVEPALRELGAVIAAPDCPGQGWDNAFSEAAVMELVQYIKENQNIDQQKIVVTGFSMGGIGTWYLAARHPEVFSAAIPMASRTDARTAKMIQEKDIPICVIHSSADRVLPLSGIKKTVADLESHGKSVRFMILQGIDHYDTSGFIPGLKQAVPWLREIWQKARE